MHLSKENLNSPSSMFFKDSKSRRYQILRCIFISIGESWTILFPAMVKLHLLLSSGESWTNKVFIEWKCAEHKNHSNNHIIIIIKLDFVSFRKWGESWRIKVFRLVNLELTLFLQPWILKMSQLMVNFGPTIIFKRWIEVKTWGSRFKFSFDGCIKMLWKLTMID